MDIVSIKMRSALHPNYLFNAHNTSKERGVFVGRIDSCVGFRRALWVFPKYRQGGNRQIGRGGNTCLQFHFCLMFVGGD